MLIVVGDDAVVGLGAKGVVVEEADDGEAEDSGEDDAVECGVG